MTARLADTFRALRSSREGAFVPFLVAGDPDPVTSLDLSRALLRAGADVLELGFAFSDPPADGPAIQAADQRALRAGATVERGFDQIQTLRSETDRPITLLVYYNLVLARGVEPFYRRAREAGADAVLVADVPIEESDPLVNAARRAGVAPVFIASELSSRPRLARISAIGDGYVYLVADVGVTGERRTLAAGLRDVVRRIRAETSLPILAGFGISTPDQVRAAMEAGADGAISGSAIARRIAEHAGDRPAMIEEIERFGTAMKAATREAG